MIKIKGGGKMLNNETIKKINKSIANLPNLEQLANTLKKELSEKEIKNLKAQLHTNTLEIEPQIKEIIELLNDNNFETVFTEFDEEGGYIEITKGKGLEEIFKKSEIEWAKEEEKEIYLLNANNQKAKWDKLYKELKKHFK